MIDDGYADSASRGLGRIYRSQYPRKVYETLALEAKELCKSGDFKEFFHETVKITVRPDGSEEKENEAARVDAHLVMLKARDQAKRKGVGVVTDTVLHLLWDGSRCIGVMTQQGVPFHADTVLLALGAALPGFLAS